MTKYKSEKGFNLPTFIQVKLGIYVISLDREKSGPLVDTSNVPYLVLEISPY